MCVFLHTGVRPSRSLVRVRVVAFALCTSCSFLCLPGCCFLWSFCFLRECDPCTLLVVACAVSTNLSLLFRAPLEKKLLLIVCVQSSSSPCSSYPARVSCFLPFPSYSYPQVKTPSPSFLFVAAPSSQSPQRRCSSSSSPTCW